MAKLKKQQGGIGFSVKGRFKKGWHRFWKLFWMVVITLDSLQCWFLFLECLEGKRTVLDGHSVTIILLEVMLIVAWILEELPGIRSKKADDMKNKDSGRKDSQ